MKIIKTICYGLLIIPFLFLFEIASAKTKIIVRNKCNGSAEITVSQLVNWKKGCFGMSKGPKTITKGSKKVFRVKSGCTYHVVGAPRIPKLKAGSKYGYIVDIVGGSSDGGGGCRVETRKY